MEFFVYANGAATKVQLTIGRTMDCKPLTKQKKAHFYLWST